MEDAEKQATFRRNDPRTFIERLKKFNLYKRLQEREINLYQRLMSRTSSANAKVNPEETRFLLDTLLSRKKLQYNLEHIVNFMVHCLCCRKKYKKIEKFKPHILFKRGVKKLDEELNIFNLIRVSRSNQIMRGILLDKRQRMLLGFQRKQMLETDTSGDSDNLDMQKHIENKSPIIRLLVLRKFRNLVMSYDG